MVDDTWVRLATRKALKPNKSELKDTHKLNSKWNKRARLTEILKSFKNR